MLSLNKLLNLTLPRAIAAGIATAYFLAPQQGWADGSSFQLPGNFAVTPGGQASYDVPIAVPPGTAGMVPAISLHYSSGGGNGIVGMGWSLTGLPSVTRCAPTIGQDKSTFNSVKISESVQFTSADDFCFGGQKLVAINGGTYGADTTLYRTELEGFTQIESHSSSGSTTPSWFELWTKAGLHMTFGHTSDSANSQIKNIAGNASASPRSTTIASWALSGVSDVKGNYYVVQYSSQNSTTGEYHPTEIDYTGNSNTQQIPYNSIIFEYNSAQPSAIVTTASGSINTTTVLLSNIQMRLGTGGSGALVSDYQLGYKTSSTNRATLGTISHCDGNGSCLPSDNFAYSSGNMISNFSTKIPSTPDGTPYYGDFLGVGATSIFWANAAGSNSVLWMNDGSGNFTVNSSKKPLVLPKLAPDNTTTCTSYRGYTGDFDGDGKTDIYWDCNDAGGYVGQGYLWISNGDGTFTSYGENFNVDGFYWPCTGNCPVNTPENVYQIATVDLNGDGRTDLIMYYTGLGPKEAPYLSAISKGDGTFSTAQQNFPVTTGLNYTFQAADFNGDGKSDLFLYEIGTTGSYTGNYYLLIGQGDGSFVNQAVTVSDSVAPSGSVVWQPYVANFGLGANAGILWKDMSSSDGTGGNGNRKLWLGNGDGSFSVIGNTSLPSSTNPWASGTHEGYLPYFGDFQGTGRTDILWYDRTTYKRDLWLNNGNGTFRAVGDFAGATSTDLSGTTSSANALPTIEDFTGHGKAEILWQVTSTTTGGTFGAPVLWTTDATQADLLSSFTTGLGATTQINYNTLANYASGSAGANYIQCSATTTGTAVNHAGANQTICPVASYPTLDLQSSMPIVSSVLLPTANTSSPTFALTYAYEGAKLDVNGRGFLGFSQQTVTDALGNVTISDFSPLWPLTGSIWYSERDNNGVTLTSISSEYFTAAPSINSVAQTGTLANGSTDSRYLNVKLVGSIQTDIDLNGTAMGSTSTSYTYDDYDNVLTSAVTITDPTTTPWTGAVYKTVTKDQYWNVSPWGMGKLACSQVASTAPSGNATTTQTRTQAWTYDQSWLMRNYYVEPDNAAATDTVPTGGTVSGCQGIGGAAEVNTAVLSRDAYGNATDILYVPKDGVSATREIQTIWGDGENRFATKIIIGHTGPQYTTTYAYNNNYGTVQTITDANSLVDTSHYDTFGRKLNESHTDGSYETWAYNPCKSIGGTQACNTGLQAQIAYRDYGNDQATAIAPNETDSYDALGRLAYKQRTGFSMVMQTLYAYDGNFNLFTVTGPFDGNTVTQPVTQYSYDAERRPTSVAYADSSVDKTGYNGLSQTVTKANKEAVTLYQHRNGDQWMSVDPAKNTTTYTDSVFNEIVSSVDPAGDRTSYGYDQLGRVNSVADPDAGITSTSYSSFGQALVVATPTGQAHMA
jgi:YD repeat-containing protein